MLLHNEKSRVHILGKVKKREVAKVKAIEEKERETERKMARKNNSLHTFNVTSKLLLISLPLENIKN